MIQHFVRKGKENNNNDDDGGDDNIILIQIFREFAKSYGPLELLRKSTEGTVET